MTCTNLLYLLSHLAITICIIKAMILPAGCEMLTMNCIQSRDDCRPTKEPYYN